jgi:hypothetical protein
MTDGFGVMFYRPESKQQVHNCRELSLEFNKINNKGNNQNYSIPLLKIKYIYTQHNYRKTPNQKLHGIY